MFIILFQGTPSGAKYIPIPVLFSPLFVLQGAGVLFALSRLVEKIITLLRNGIGNGTYFTFTSRAHDCFGFLHHGSRYDALVIIWFENIIVSILVNRIPNSCIVLWIMFLTSIVFEINRGMSLQFIAYRNFDSLWQATWLVVDWWRKSRGTGSTLSRGDHWVSIYFLWTWLLTLFFLLIRLYINRRNLVWS